MFFSELEKFRVNQNSTAVEFAKKLDISPTMVYKAEHGILLSYWRYTRKINAVFGASFPDMSICKDCGCEFEGCEKLCPSCAEKKKAKAKKQVPSLRKAAKSAESLNISYGAFSAGISVNKTERTTKPPEFLCLGRTITI